MSFHCSMNVKIPGRVLSGSFSLAFCIWSEHHLCMGRYSDPADRMPVQLSDGAIIHHKISDENSGNSTLHYFLSIKCNDDKLFKVCRLTRIPDRRTVDRRFQNLPIGDIIGTMGNLFVSEEMADDTSASVDSSLLKADGPAWHKSDMKNNRLPISGTDTDARWG